MANKEALVQAVKSIVALWRGGSLEEAYKGYRELFAAPDFTEHRPEDQRSALRLMVHAKGAPNPDRPTPEMIEAHQAAVASLNELVNAHREPGDYEMLGMCYVITGDPKSADQAFRAALTIERERNPQSDLCGALMKRIAAL